MIEFNQVTKQYGETTALNEVSFKIENGQIFGQAYIIEINIMTEPTNWQTY